MRKEGEGSREGTRGEGERREEDIREGRRGYEKTRKKKKRGTSRKEK